MAESLNRHINIYVDSGAAEVALQKLSAQSVKLSEKINKLQQDGKDATAEIAKLGDVNTQIDRLNKKISGELSPSIKDLTGFLTKARNELKALSPEDAKFKELAKQIGEAETALNKQISTIGGLKKGFTDFAKEVKAIALGVFIGNTVQSAVAAVGTYFSGIVNGAARLSDELADVAKTTGFTTEEVKNLNKEISKIDTRTSASALRDIAVVGGQLGLAKDQILGFVKAIDVASVALSDEFAGGAKEVADVLGRLRNVLIDTKTGDVANDLLRIGNALNVLGAEGSATAPVVADFANRIASIGIPLGATSGQVLGLSATLQELNVSTERGGTAVTKIFQRMANNSEEFAKVAGLSAQEFKNIVNTDLVGAFELVLQGSKKSGESATELTKILDSLGVDGSGASEVFAKLGNNIGLLNEKINLASNSLRFTTSLTDEFNIKNQTLGAVIDKLDKSFRGLVQGTGITTFFKSLLGNILDFINALKLLPDFISRNATAFIAIAGAATTYALVLSRATILSIANTTAERANALARTLSAAATSVASAASAAYATVVGLLTGEITAAAVATRIWNAVLSLNPFVAIGIAITGVVEAIKIYSDNTAKAIALEREKRDLHNELTATLKTLDGAQIELNNSLAKFNELSAEEKKNLLDKIRIQKQQAIEELEQAKKKQEQIKNNNTTVSPLEAGFAFITSGGSANSTFADKLVNKSLQNGIDAAAQYDEEINKLKQDIDELSSTENQVADSVEAYNKAMKISTDTTAGLQEKQRLLQIALNNSVRGSDDYKKAQTELLKVQEQLNKVNPVQQKTVGNNAEIEKAKQLNEELLKIKSELLLADKANDEQEFIRLTDKYNKLRALASGNKASLLQIEQLYQQELAQLQNKNFASQSEKEYAASLSAAKQYFENLKELQKQQYADGAISKEEYNDNVKALDLSLLQTQASIAADYKETVLKAGADEVEFTKQANDAKLNLEIEFNEQKLQLAAKTEQQLQDIVGNSGNAGKVRLAALSQLRDLELKNFRGTEEQKNNILRRYENQRQKIQLESINQFADNAGKIANQALDIVRSIDTVIANNENKKLQADKQNTEQQKQHYKDLLDKKLITEEQYNKKVEDLQKGYETRAAAVKKKQFEREKAANIIQAVIATALAVVKSLPNIPLAVLSAAAGAAQIAAIASQPVPEFGKGGYLNEGVKHSEGGMPIINPKTGKKVAEIEVGEVILSSNTRQNNPELVGALLHSSMYENGRRIKDVMPGLNTPNYVINYSRAFSDLRFFEKGAVYGKGIVNFDGGPAQSTTGKGIVNVNGIGNPARSIAGRENTTGAGMSAEDLLALMHQELVNLNKKQFGLNYQTFKKQEKLVNNIQKKSF